jgi:uncharacterized iron-regulated membrane protein
VDTASLRLRWQLLHAAAGAVFGLILFVLCFSGAVAVLGEQFTYWQRRGEQLPSQAQPALSRLLTQLQGTTGWPQRIAIVLPQPHDPALRVVVDQQPQRRLDPLTLQPLAETDCRWTRRMIELHRNLHGGFPGRIVVSLFGAALALLLISGVVNQARHWHSTLRLRVNAGWRVTLTDMHRLLGWCSAPWLLLLALTGILSGLGALGTLALAAIAFPEGGMRQALSTLMAMPATSGAGSITPMIELPVLLQNARTDEPSFMVERIELQHWGHSNATATLSGSRDGVLSTALFERSRYRGDIGKQLDGHSARVHGLWTQTFIAMAPLHQARYGGALMRWWHALIGLIAALLALSGSVLWLDRRRHSGRAAVAWQRTAVIGIGGGLLLASTLALAVSACPGLPWWLEPTMFWGTWLLAPLAATRRNWHARALPWLASTVMLALTLAAVLDLLQRLGQPVAVATPAWIIDALLLSLAMASGYMGWRWRGKQ